MKVLSLLLLLWTSILANDIEVTIVYGNGTPDKIVQTHYTPGMSALEVLQKVSIVQTSKTGRFLFVRSIDGLTSQVGKFGWFYLIDGRSVHTTAENYLLKNEKSMLWIYKVEACY